MKSYKETLLMPKTNFEMKASLFKKEKKYHQYWKDINLYQQILLQNKNNEKFILHDGPPYANGSIHIGHALNKILKDIIVRQKSMLGFYSPFLPGWDTHGLPIENKMLMHMKKNKNDFNIIDLRKKAKNYALKQIEIQKKQFLSLSLLSDFKNYYVTLDKNYEAKQLTIFKKMALDGLIYKALKPVYWSPSSQSALAEAEVVYLDHISPSIYVTLDIIEGNKLISSKDKLIIWTTTPWTLIANAGVAVDKEIDYILINVAKNNYIVAKDCLNSLLEIMNWKQYKILKTIKGNDLLDIKYSHPLFLNKTAKVVSGHHVTTNTGTGLVHIAPLFGEDDYIIGKKNNLDFIMHINDDGTLNNVIKKYNGLFYLDVNKLIGEELKAKNALLSLKFIKHSFPHDWRTNKPIMYRATPQWFVSISKIKQKIKKSLLTVKSQQNWIIERMNIMIDAREDWCISRQRAWGVPIPIFYNENKKPIIKEDILQYVIEIIKKHGSNAWYEKTVDELLPPKYQKKYWTKEKDIMDVWFDSGVSHFAVDIYHNKPPFNLYLEGSDQFRGWFNSSLITSIAYNNKSPYSQLISHGFILDEKNQKMSKSKGNIIDPNKIIEKYGADILRLWVANTEYFQDITISENIIKQNIDIYRRIRGTIRYILGNLNDFNWETDHIESLEDIHLLMNERLENLIYNTSKHYEKYNFNKIMKEVNIFLISTSSFYFEIAKDYLYTYQRNSKIRRSFQTIMYKILNSIIRILAPILPTTMEEAYENFNVKNKKKSIHLEQFLNNIKVKKISTIQEEKWVPFFQLRESVQKMIENMKKTKKIRKSNEVCLFVKTNNEFIKKLDLKKLLMVGDVKKTNKDTYIEKFDSVKCPRCWNHFEKIISNTGLCDNCYLVINN